MSRHAKQLERALAAAEALVAELAVVVAERDRLRERIERAWELCSWETSTKAEIAATLIPDPVAGEAG